MSSGRGCRQNPFHAELARESTMELKLGLEWELPSNSGRSMVSGTLKRVHDDAIDRSLLFDMSFRGEAFDKYEEGGLVKNYDISMNQVAISQSRLSHNVSLLSDWLKTPRELELDFSDTPQQTFMISLRKRDDVISSVEKPVCTVSCESFLLKCEIGFVVDQSCIRILRDSLATFSA
jgi:hypothetical protein